MCQNLNTPENTAGLDRVLSDPGLLDAHTRFIEAITRQYLREMDRRIRCVLERIGCSVFFFPPVPVAV